MTKQKALLLLIFSICTIWNSTKAQSYSVESFEGKKVNIQLTENVTKESWYVAKVSCLTDSLFLDNYNGVQEVHVLSHKFLEIVYNTQGGSGSQFRNTLILSVKKNKIIVAILANSFGKAFGGDSDGSLYIVKFNITRNNKSNFKLTAHIYDRHKSNSYPLKNYLRSENKILSFDSVRNIFYTTHIRTTQLYIISDPKTQQPNEQQIKGLLPIIALSKSYYYYLKGEWYKRVDNHNLCMEYYR